VVISEISRGQPGCTNLDFSNELRRKGLGERKFFGKDVLASYSPSAPELLNFVARAS